MTPEEKEILGKAVGKIPSGLAILTVQFGAERGALLASWFQQAGFEPLSILVAVNKKRPLNDLLNLSKTFALNILAQGDKALFAAFARGIEPGTDPFAGLKTRAAPQGSPVLEDSLAYLECSLAGELDAGDHRLILGHVLNGAILKEGESWVHLRKSGLNY